MLPGKTSRAGILSWCWLDQQCCLQQQQQAELHLLKERGYLTPSPQPKGLCTLLDSCHKAPALQSKLCRLSGWKRTWNDSREIEVFLQNTTQCSFCLRKCSSFFPKFSPPPLHGCQWPRFGLDMGKSRSSLAGSSQASGCPRTFLLPALSSSSPLDHLTFSHPHNFYTMAFTIQVHLSQSLTIPILTFGHCCYCNLFFQQQCDTADVFCALP